MLAVFRVLGFRVFLGNSEFLGFRASGFLGSSVFGGSRHSGFRVIFKVFTKFSLGFLVLECLGSLGSVFLGLRLLY